MAYVTATIVQVDPPDVKGNVHAIIQYTGNAGEPVVNDDFYFNNTVDTTQLQTQVSSRVINLNGYQSTKANLTVGGTVPVTAPAPVVPTAAQTNRTAFVADWQRLKAADAWIVKFGPLTSLPAAQQTYYNNLKARTQTEGNQVITDFGADVFFTLIFA